MTNTSTMQTKTNEHSLPDGWRWAKIGDIAEVSTGGTPDTNHPEYYGGDIRWLKSGDVKGTYIDEVPNRISQLGLDNSNARIHPAGSVMLAMSGQGKTRGTSAILRVPSTCSQSVAAILPSEHAIPEIIHYALVNRYDETRRITGDDERTGLNLKIIREIVIPLPPLDEQRRILSRLNEQLAAVESARRAAEEQLQAARQLPSVYMRDVFESEEAREWDVKKVLELCRRIDYGYTASADFTIKEPKFLRITDIQNGKVNWAQVPGCKINSNEEKNNLLSDGDIVFARTGATTGKSFLIRKPPRAVFASYLIRLQHNDEVTADYLYAFFQSDSYWQQIRENARGAAQPNVNATLLGQITLPVAPVSDQERIISAINDKLVEISKMTYAIESQLAEIESLPASLLREAFAGQL